MSRDLGEVATTFPSEVTTFTWRIKNFPAVVSMGNYPNIEFDAGQSIGLPSKWSGTLAYTSRKYDKRVNQISSEDCSDSDYPTKFIYLRVKQEWATTRGLSEACRVSNNFYCVATIKMADDPGKDFVSISSDHKTSTNGAYVGQLDALKDHALIDGELVIYLKFTLCDPKLSSSWKETSSAKKLVEQSPVEVFANLGPLLESGDNSDFVIKVKSKSSGDGKAVEIKVHKNILGLRSKVFQRMLKMTERSNGTMLIEDLSPVCVKMMLKWMYTGVLDEGWKKIPVELANAANKYGLTLLLQFLDQNLHFVCSLENAENLREAAKLHGLETATKNVVNFIAANGAAFYMQKNV